ncbi:MAG TPA: LPS assembly protein LptD [Terracidiphilus sp.]|jgi:LPS-assembly protein|nr:LPS assembly protein LptD [Terracidiphilus sp.]
MHPRNFVFITVLVLCHLQLRGQVLTNALPPAGTASPAAPDTSNAALPDDPGQEILPVAEPEAAPDSGVPVRWEADHQNRTGDTWTLSGDVVVHYRSYTVRADKVTYHQATSELEAEGHLQLTGGQEDIFLTASHGEMRLATHTARFYDANGTLGVRRAGSAVVYSTANPFLFSGRVLVQNGEGSYRIVDGTMTNCRLPHPDWQLFARAIKIDAGKASAANTFFKLFGVPIFYLPYLRHPVDETGRESGLLIPVVSTGSSIRGYTFGEQIYVVLNRSTDFVVGAEYFSKRGYAPNGDFRYKGPGLDHLTARWNALLDRGIAAAAPATGLVNQGGVDISAEGRKDFTPDTRLAGDVEYLSSYVYRLVFNDNYSQAVNSQVLSSVALTHNHEGYIASGSADRLQTFAGSTAGDEARILHLPSVRFDVLDRPLGTSPLYWGVGSSIDHLARSEPDFHAHNVGRVDVYPHISLPFAAGGWSIVPEAALRETFYSGSQTPDLTGANGGTPFVSHDPLNRTEAEASVDVRPPAVERDFTLGRWHRELRHVIEPELTYRFVGGIGTQAQDVLLEDTADIATDTNEATYSLTQRFYLRSLDAKPCADGTGGGAGECAAQPREWASWQIAQKFFIDPNFGGAVLPGRRNVFDSTLDLSGVAYLTAPRNLSPVISRLRFEAVRNLRVEWDADYDTRAGHFGADNLYAGYSWGRTTVGIGHALLNAVDEQGAAASTIKSQQVQPFIQIGKQSGRGLNFAANGGYDFVHGALQYGGVQAVYNFDCCGLTVGYRRFELGSVGTVSRNETEFLYSFTLANFGSVGDIRHATSVFHDPSLPPSY